MTVEYLEIALVDREQEIGKLKEVNQKANVAFNELAGKHNEEKARTQRFQKTNQTLRDENKRLKVIQNRVQLK